MTVFKTFLKVLKSYKGPIIMYTAFLLFFGGFIIQTSDNATSFVTSKPDVLVIDNDHSSISQNLVNYMEQNSNFIDIEDNVDARKDALFYRDVSYIIYIPKQYGEQFLQGLKPPLEIEKSNDYDAALAEILLTRYIRVANTYQQELQEEAKIIQGINDTLNEKIQIEVTSKLDTNQLAKSTFYYNFLSYSMLAACVYVICLVLSSFKQENIHKRTVISSMNYQKYNRLLLLSNGLYAFTMWVLYIIMSFILLGSSMLSIQGLIYIINAFLFMMCALIIALLIGNLTTNKNAINGIVNVIALGSSFLCGAFVPAEFLPSSVLTFAHILPTYWYIQTNEALKGIETFTLETLKPIFLNMSVLLLFMLGFIITINVISRKKRKIG